MKQTIAIALSGGVDSATAAYLLKKQGHHLIGIHFTTGFEDRSGCSVVPDDISRISEKLGIGVTTIDCRTVFKTRVVDYFTRAYEAGRTPNPCMQCNRSIKFGVLLDFAREMDVSALATGHYAKVEKDDAGNYRLFRGADRAKDQSYFLSMLAADQLAAARFPLGNMTKSEVRKLAARKGYAPAEKQESQDICFIKSGTYGEFLAAQEGFTHRPGIIEDTRGNAIGEHNGLYLFTIGQRRGINCPGPEPYYVVRMDHENNRLIVGSKKDLFRTECRVAGINWISPPAGSSSNVFTQVRYRHTPAPAELVRTGPDTAVVRFDEPQSALTPGQGAVFYAGDEVLGGGWIKS